MRKRKVLTVIIGAAVMCAITACGSKNVVNTGETKQTENTQQIANPWIEYSTLEEAKKIAGFDMSVPESIDGYSIKTISVMDNKMIQVEFGDGKDKTICFRKCPAGDEGNDISGDYNEHSFTERTEINKNMVTLKGEDGKVKIAIWNDGSYSYSIDSTEMMAEEKMTELAARLK